MNTTLEEDREQKESVIEAMENEERTIRDQEGGRDDRKYKNGSNDRHYTRKE